MWEPGIRSEGQRVVLMVWSEPGGLATRLQVHDEAASVDTAARDLLAGLDEWEALAREQAPQDLYQTAVAVRIVLDDVGHPTVGWGHLGAPADHAPRPVREFLAHARAFLRPAQAP